MPRITVFVFAALIFTGVIIHAHQSERGAFEDRARGLASNACVDDDTPQRCRDRLERSHADCFMVTFDPGRSTTKFDRAPATLDSHDYLDCVTRGFEPWRDARNGRRREQARLRRGEI